MLLPGPADLGVGTERQDEKPIPKETKGRKRGRQEIAKDPGGEDSAGFGCRGRCFGPNAGCRSLVLFRWEKPDPPQNAVRREESEPPDFSYSILTGKRTRIALPPKVFGNFRGRRVVRATVQHTFSGPGPVKSAFRLGACVAGSRDCGIFRKAGPDESGSVRGPPIIMEVMHTTATSRVPGETAAADRWELAAEIIALKVRWFGLVLGFLLVRLEGTSDHVVLLHALLGVGAVYALLDTAWSLRGQVFLGRMPLLISGLEALFIGLLCYFHTGPDSPFRYYYLLSVLCCAVRHATSVTAWTWTFHVASYLTLFLASDPGRRDVQTLFLTLVLLTWVTWAGLALAVLLKRVGEHLGRLNRELADQQGMLQERIAERTRELQEAQAHVLHQEKMAAFGLLAAGIAHEIGNPLTAISSMVQMLRKRPQDAYTQEKLDLVGGQLQRIQGTLRELAAFGRPTETAPTRVALADVIGEAIDLAKFHKRVRGRHLREEISPSLPPVLGVRDQLVQVFLNLVLNAIDATAAGGTIVLGASVDGDVVEATVADDGPGIPPDLQERVFQAYFTTKEEGTGLGLFVTRKMLADQGGSIACTSTPGAGAVFRVRLPRADRAGAAAPTVASDGPAAASLAQNLRP